MKLNTFKIRSKRQEHKERGNERKGITELIMMVGFLLIFAISLITLVYLVLEGKQTLAQVITHIKQLLHTKK